MLAEIISIGDEMTSGQRLDTNSQWLSQRLGELGIPVGFHTTVADDLAANVAVFRVAIERADLVVATGGLGPTADDLTRDALSEVSGTELVLDGPSLEKIRAMFAHFGREMPPRNRVQSLFPRGSQVISNDHGTAPGIDMTIERPGRAACRLFAMPGVPAEMFRMWEASVAPKLADLGGRNQVLRHRVIKCFGVGESHLESMLPDLIRRGRQPSVGITVHGATLALRITATGTDEATCLAAMQPTVDTIYQTLGELVFGEGNDELEQAVARLLIEKRKTLSVAEWGTGGAIASLLGSLPETGERLLCGLSASTPAAWEQLLGVPATLAVDQNGRTAAYAEALAIAARSRSGSDLALSVSNLPYESARLDHEAPKVFFAVATAQGATVRSAPHFGEASLRRTRTAKQGLNLVRLTLRKA